MIDKIARRHMFKRFQVLDLFHGNKDFNNIKEWVDVNKELPKEKNGMYKVRLSDGNDITAYYCQDKCLTMMKYCDSEPSYWYEKGTGAPLYDVTHWGKN